MFLINYMYSIMEQNEQTKEFIIKAREVHGDKYDYSKVEYVNSNTNVIITCNKHGDFLQRPTHHINRKQGCKKCSGRCSNTNDFIEKVKEIHGDRYDYSKTNYINCKTPIVIICKEHGEFTQTPDGHFQGRGCHTCGINDRRLKQTKSIQQFIQQSINVHGYKYDYSKVEYKNCKIPVIIICNEHGEFQQTPEVHYLGSGCSKCAGRYQPSTEEFIERAREIHGDTYDYSKIEYINSNTHVTILCKEHGEFQQTPQKHLMKRGCDICGGSYKSNTEEFIIKAREIHEDTYDYSKVEYIDNKTNVIIICKKHGEFQQTPHTHLRNCGCDSCGTDRTAEIRRKPLFEFIQQAKNAHGEKYDYSKVEYINGNTKIIIICKIHGEFQQTPNSHRQGNGCSKCSGQYVSSTEEYIEKAKEIHGDKYDYSKVNYTKAKDKIIIICKIHGDFEQEAYCHSIGVGCSKCSGKYSPNTEEYIEKAIEKHGDKYDYSKVEYISGKTNIIIICKKHGEFQQNAQSHLSGHGCSLCVNKTEGKLYEQLLPIYPSLITQFKQDWCKKQLCLPYDFCIPEYKIIIELDGEQHFRQVANWSSPEEQFENDKFKEERANNNGYSVIRLLQEDVFYDTYDWVKELCEAIEEVKSSEEITNVYLCKNDEYEQF